MVHLVIRKLLMCHQIWRMTGALTLKLWFFYSSWRCTAEYEFESIELHCYTHPMGPSSHSQWYHHPLHGLHQWQPTSEGQCYRQHPKHCSWWFHSKQTPVRTAVCQYQRGRRNKDRNWEGHHSRIRYITTDCLRGHCKGNTLPFVRIVPGLVKNVRVVVKSEYILHVSWSPPTYTNGVLTGYTVVVTNLENPSDRILKRVAQNLPQLTIDRGIRK